MMNCARKKLQDTILSCSFNSWTCQHRLKVVRCDFWGLKRGQIGQQRCRLSTVRPSTKIVQDTSQRDFQSEKVTILGENYDQDGMTNITKSLINKIGRNLHRQGDHPLGMIKSKIEAHMHGNHRSRYGGCIFAAVDNLSPVVTTEQNFDSLLVAPDHVTRAKNDNYYINNTYMLRAHTSAHQRDMIRSGWDAFLVTGDVYRRDEIDRSHYPVFHQMEGVRLFGQSELFSNYDVCLLLLLHAQFAEYGSFEHDPRRARPTFYFLSPIVLLLISGVPVPYSAVWSFNFPLSNHHRWISQKKKNSLLLFLDRMA